MSSTEQAPEPTMDEILASIRKIISDDEPEQAAQSDSGPASAQSDSGPASAPSADGLADDLSNAIADSPAQTEEPDDILDLTQVVQPQQAAPSAPEPAPSVSEAVSPGPPQGDALQAAIAETAGTIAPELETPQPPADAPQSASPQGDADSDIAALLAEAGVEDTINEMGAASAPAEISGEEASITEALRAMDDDAGGAAAMPTEDASMSEGAETGDATGEATAPDVPGEIAMHGAADDLSAALEAADSPAADPLAAVEAAIAADEAGPAIEMPAPANHEPAEDAIPAEPEAASAGNVTEPEAVAADDLALPEIPEAGIDALQSGGAVAEAPAELAEPETAEPEAAEPEAVAAEETPAEETSGDIAATTQSSPSTFEEGIKDMLKPMLSKWLDDNMERIVHDAVKEQVGSNDPTNQ